MVPHPTSYLDALEHQLDRSRDRDGLQSLFVAIAARPIEIRIPRAHDGSLLFRAFQHLPKHQLEPEAVFEVWDAASSRLPFLTPPASGHSRKWVHHGLTNENQAATYDRQSRLLCLFDRSKKRGFYYAEDLNKLPYWEFGFPLRTLFHWWSQEESFQFVHSAAITSSSGLGFLLPGVGGSGKSTTSLLALKLGYGFLGDDYVVVEPGDQPIVHSVYCSAKIDHSTLDRHPWLARYIGSWGESSEKHVAFMSGLMADNTPVSTRISAIVLPRVTDGAASRLSNATVSDCLRAIAPTTVMHLPFGTETILAKIQQVCDNCKAYHLDLGSDAQGVAAALAQLGEEDV